MKQADILGKYLRRALGKICSSGVKRILNNDFCPGQQTDDLPIFGSRYETRFKTILVHSSIVTLENCANLGINKRYKRLNVYQFKEL